MQELFEKWNEQSIFSASFFENEKLKWRPDKTFLIGVVSKLLKESGLLEEPLSDKQPFIFLQLQQYES